MFRGLPRKSSFRCLALGLVCCGVGGVVGCGAPSGKTYDSWGAYLGDEGRRHYSGLTEIDSAALDRLGVAWTYHSGDATDGTRVQCNPLYGDGRVYVITAGLALAALDAGTGEELWRFAPFADGAAETWTGQSRGMHLWRDPAAGLNVVWAVADRIYLLDAATGQLRPDFGDGGAVDLRDGLGGVSLSDQLAVTTPGVIYRDLVILGFMTAERHPAVRGCIRAYDLRTGELAWRFGNIPDDGDPAAATWDPEQLAAAAGANNWCGMSLDEARGTVFVPTGTAVDDFYGGRRLGDNLYANSLLALDAATGERRWHRQLIHHDVWDYDLPSPPTLVEVRRGGRTIDAVAQPTKFGYLYVFDRDTGEPLYDIHERPAPASDIPGEQTSATQPHSALPPFVPQTLTEADLHPRAAGYDSVRAHFAALRKGLFTPPSLGGTLMSPGYDGGANWGGAGTVPGSGTLVLNANVHPSVVRLREEAGIANPGERAYVSYCASCHGTDRAGGTFHGNIPNVQRQALTATYTQATLASFVAHGRGAMPAFGFLGEETLEQLARYLLDLPVDAGAPAGQERGYAHTGYDWFADREGYPAVRPPWGTLTRYDLNAGTIAWQRPLGVDSVWASRGDSLTGTANYGGPLITATGLVFIGATTDAKFRAFSLATGTELWQTTLPFDGVATPASYEHNGRQYILIAAGGGKMSERRGDAYVAYALQ